MTVDASTRVACLSQSFVLRSTLVLKEEDRVLEEGRDFRLDADAGCFTLLTADTTGAGRLLVAEYQAMSPALLGVYRLEEDPHRRRAPKPVSTGDGATRPGEFTAKKETEGLDISGSKTFAIEVGNRRDLKLRQSLDLRLIGNVTPDVSLLAILSDQDLPFQPEGNTAELSDLDRVLVEIRSPRAGASLGDVSLSSSGTAFLDVQRELEGFSGRAQVSRVETRGAFASAKGEFATRELFGEDGKQGPYRLTDRTGATNIVVVAGSEKVWLDGVLMKRGTEEDYVFDYALGEITFTSRRPISANSQITVDYQYSTGRYKRRVGFAATEGDLGNAGTLEVAFFSEGDDPNDPLGGSLSPSERAELAAVGDSAQVQGGTGYVGPGLGDYQLVVDSVTGKDIFVYVGDTGDYNVTFINVGEDKGEYAPLELITGSKQAYEFVGEGKGDFIPRRDLPAPERKQVTDVRWGLVGERGRLMVEGALSNVDGNVLSDIHDGDNLGGALIAEGSAANLVLGSEWTLTPRFRVRRVGEHFQSPGRIRSSFYGREWNLTGTEAIRDESLGELAAELRWGERLRWDSEVGRLALADTFSSVRQRQTVGYTDRWVAAGGGWTATWDDVGDRTGRLNRESAEIKLRRWKVQPRTKGFHETRRRATGGGERHRDWELGMEFPLGGWPVRVDLGGGRRLDDSLRVADDTWREIRDARRMFGALEGRLGNLSLLLRYEARRVRGEGSGNERQDTGRLDLRHKAARGGWNAVVSADVGTVGLRRRIKTIEPDSTGFYDQFGNYVGPGGGYDVQFDSLGVETLVGKVSLSTRLRWSPPGSEVRVPEILRKFAWDGFVNLDESSSLPLVQPKYFLDPGSYLNRETTLDGRVNSRQTVDLFPANRGLGLRLRQDLRRRITQNPQSNAGSKLVEIRNEDDYTATVRSNPSPGWDAEVEGSLGAREEEVDLGGGISRVENTDLRSGAVRGGRRFRLLDGGGRVSAEATYSKEAGPTRESIGWILRPRLQWSLAGLGRVDVRYAFTELVSQRGATYAPGAILIPGWRLDVLTEARLNKGIVLTTAVGLDRPRGLTAVTEGRMEIRGTF